MVSSVPCVLGKFPFPFSFPQGHSAPQSIIPELKTCAGTACWPCRQRKVKCDNKQPCENCVKRDHAGLCSYNPKNAAKASAGSVSGIKRPRSPGTGSDSSLKRDDDRWPRTTGTSRFTKPPDAIAHICGVRGLDQTKGPSLVEDSLIHSSCT